MMQMNEENIFSDNFFTFHEKVKLLLCSVTEMIQFLQGI